MIQTFDVYKMCVCVRPDKKKEKNSEKGKRRKEQNPNALFLY